MTDTTPDTTSAPCTVRRARPDDALAIMQLRVAAARALAARFGSGPWAGEATERSVLAGFRQSFVMLGYIGSEPVATFRLTTRKPWAIDRDVFTAVTRPLYLTDMAVHPSWQRHGIGRACLEHAMEFAHAFPAQAIWLDAYDAPAGAAPFYAACGFRECGRRTYRGTPLVYFERAVPTHVPTHVPARATAHATARAR